MCVFLQLLGSYLYPRLNTTPNLTRLVTIAKTQIENYLIWMIIWTPSIPLLQSPTHSSLFSPSWSRAADVINHSQFFQIANSEKINCLYVFFYGSISENPLPNFGVNSYNMGFRKLNRNYVFRLQIKLNIVAYLLFDILYHMNYSRYTNSYEFIVRWEVYISSILNLSNPSTLYHENWIYHNIHS
jgi:hypothetical protein